MPARTITITDDVYRILKALKQQGERFSQVIRRLARTRSALDLVGALPPTQGKVLETTVAKTRSEVAKAIERRARDLRR